MIDGRRLDQGTPPGGGGGVLDGSPSGQGGSISRKKN